MSRLLSGFLAVVVLGSSASAQVIDRPVAPPPRDAAPATGRSTIRGRVLTADAGQPVRRATVRVTASELQVPRLMLTDADGRYEFSELPPGQYSVNASKTTFVSWSYGQTRPNQPARPLILADNQAATNVDIRLPRGAVIAGRITDELGDPVPAARVTPMRQQFRQGERTLTFAGATAMTNDIGEYRIFGLTPGQYYISAMPQRVRSPPSGRRPVPSRVPNRGTVMRRHFTQARRTPPRPKDQPGDGADAQRSTSRCFRPHCDRQQRGVDSENPHGLVDHSARGTLASPVSAAPFGRTARSAFRAWPPERTFCETPSHRSRRHRCP